MTTIDLECPSCGRIGSVPRDKTSGRLVCRKCHNVFHLSPSGRPVLGEPPSERRPHAEHAQAAARPTEMPSLSELLGAGGGSLPFKPLVALLAVLLLVLVGYNASSVLSSVGLGNSVTPIADRVVAAFARQDLDTVKQNALTESVDDAVSFYNKIGQTIQEIKRESLAGQVIGSAIVLDVNPANDQAQVVAVFTGAKGQSRNEKIADAAGTNEAAKSVHETMFFFAKDKDGRWKLDGRHCLNPGM